MEMNCENGYHEYTEKECTCGHVFCWSCCSSTNVQEGGKYSEDFMPCPVRSKDFYAEGEK
jgi:hypothetical protein